MKNFPIPLLYEPHCEVYLIIHLKGRANVRLYVIKSSFENQLRIAKYIKLTKS